MIRVAAKAIIIKENKLLVIENFKDRIYYTLPGGGQKHNEDLHQTLKRECIEEIGVDVKVGELQFVCEYISDRHDDSIHKDGFQQMDLFFKCELVGNIGVEETAERDVTQTGFKWLNIDELNNSVFYPMKLREHIVRLQNGNKEVTYLGEVD